MSPVTVCGYKDQPAEDVDHAVQANNVDYVPGQPIKALYIQNVLELKAIGSIIQYFAHSFIHSTEYLPST